MRYKEQLTLHQHQPRPWKKKVYQFKRPARSISIERRCAGARGRSLITPSRGAYRYTYMRFITIGITPTAMSISSRLGQPSRWRPPSARLAFYYSVSISVAPRCGPRAYKRPKFVLGVLCFTPIHIAVSDLSLHFDCTSDLIGTLFNAITVSKLVCHVRFHSHKCC